MKHPSVQPPDRLEDVGILELLKNDERPTFILESSDYSDHFNTRIAFRNAALDAHVCSCATEFECWARMLSVETIGKEWTFGERVWSKTIVRGRWMVVYCSQGNICPAKLPGIPVLEEAHHTQPVQSVAGDGLAIHVVGDSGDADRSQLGVPHYPSLIDGQYLTPKVIDWTRYDIADLPPYIQYMKAYDWSSTALGPMSDWPDALRGVVVGNFSHPDPRIILWGENMAMLYNQAAVPRIGHRHPIALGQPGSETFAELWPHVAHIIRPAVFDGVSTKVAEELYFMERNGLTEETYWSFVMSPLLGSNGYTQGVLDSFTEQTGTIVAKRRRDAVAHASQSIIQSKTLKELWPEFLRSLDPYGVDIPYAIIYSADDGASPTSSTWSNRRTRYVLEGSLGIQADESSLLEHIDLASPAPLSNALADACRRAFDLRQPVTLRSEDGSLHSSLSSAIPGRGWGDAVTHVCVMPVTWSSAGPLAFLVLALNPRRPFNDDHIRFAYSMRDVLAKPASLVSQQRFEVLHDSLAEQLKVSTLAAARNEEKFARLAESAPIGICTFGADGRTVFVNDGYLSLIGVSRPHQPEALWDLGSTWHDEVIPEDLPKIREAWDTVIQRHADVATVEFRLKRPWISIDKATGSEVVGETWLLNKGTAELDEDDNVVFIHGWLFDVSAQHFSESLMAQRLEDALQNKRQSENFIDMVSHELRNPLSAILQSADGILTTLEEAPGEDTWRRSGSQESIVESAQTIVLCAQHQKTIVDDILTLSKLDSNLLLITPDKVQPPALIDKVLKMYEAELAGKEIEAHLEIEKSFTEILHNHDYVMLDPSRLLQVVINLLTNAIKFTQYMEERRITIYLSASYNAPSGAAHDLIFIETRSHRHGDLTTLPPEWGTGQELYLQLTVQDTGRGLDEEEMKMLFQRFSQASPKTYKQYGGSGLGLFISRELTELQGGQIGVSSKGVGKGSTFAFYVRARRCVVSDGADVSLPVPLQHTQDPGVATISVLSGDRVVPSLAPSSATVKPYLTRVPTHGRSGAKATAIIRESGSEQIHVLVVEDNLVNQKVMVQQLKRIGCIVHVANNGLECLDFLRRTPFWKNGHELHDDDSSIDHTPISIVLMDWEMPIMDGLSCVREIRQLQTTGHIVSHVPVIAVTANARGEQISVAMAAGMDDLVTKPFRIPDLVPVMDALVAKYPSPFYT